MNSWGDVAVALSKIKIMKSDKPVSVGSFLGIIWDCPDCGSHYSHGILGDKTPEEVSCIKCRKTYKNRP